MKNSTNIRTYRYLAPVYDFFFGGFYGRPRKAAFSLLPLKPDDRVLLVGVGTGEDLQFVPDACSVSGIDISEDMLARARKKAGGRKVDLVNMNAERLTYPDAAFDCAVMNLILSVVENPRQALSEAVRVVRPGGRILVFDKFVDDPKRISLLRRVVNRIAFFVGTDVTRCFEDIARGLPVSVITDERTILGKYRSILLTREPAGGGANSPHR